MSTGSRTFTISNAETAWHLDLHDGRLASTRVENRLSGSTYALSATAEVALTLSASPDGLAEPKRRCCCCAARRPGLR
jgi:hypothetical protein